MNPLPSSPSRPMSWPAAASSADRSRPPRTGATGSGRGPRVPSLPPWSRTTRTCSSGTRSACWGACRMPRTSSRTSSSGCSRPAGAARSPRSGRTCTPRSATPAPTSWARGPALGGAVPSRFTLIGSSTVADGPPEACAGRRGIATDRGRARAIAARAGRSDPAARLRRAAAGRDRRGPRLPDQHRQLPPAATASRSCARRGGKEQTNGLP